MIETCMQTTNSDNGIFQLELTNSTGSDLNFYVQELDSNHVPISTKCGFGDTSLIRDGETEKETIKINYGDQIYYKAKLSDSLTGLHISFNDSLLVIHTSSYIENDSTHFKIIVEKVIKGPLGFHVPGHICSPTDPFCED